MPAKRVRENGPAPRTGRRSAELTASEAAFFARLDAVLRESRGPAKPAGEAPAVETFVAGLFRKKDEYLVRDRYETLGEAAEFFTKVAGVSFEGRQDLLAGLREGDELALVRRPENPHDANAIAVLRGTLQVGFLHKGAARRLAPKIDAGIGYRAEVASVTGGGSRSRGLNIHVRRERAPRAVTSAPAGARAERDEIRRALIGDRAVRPSQDEVLRRLEAGRSTLAVMGTGRGKSFCYQYPAAVAALERGAKTLVIYPLRALANDQYEALVRRLGPFGLRIFRANGAIGEDERFELNAALETGDWDLICSTPEFVHYHRERFVGAHNRPELLVVDEAHHLFESKHRSAYAQLGRGLAALGGPRVLALTATAGTEAFAHVRKALGIDAWVIDPTIRENLHVVDARGTKDKVAYIRDALQGPGKAIVYCNSRPEATKVAERLRVAFGDEVAFYHAGIPSAERAVVESLFREGTLRAVVATSAFGEGIDLPDVRNVFLYHLNFSFTEFNQQAGRAGRDGADAAIHLLYGETDRRINDYIIAKSAPSLAALRELYRGMRKLARDGELRMDNAAIAGTLEMDMVDSGTVGIALRIFEDAGLVELRADDDGRAVRFAEVREKIDLTKSERFAEGEAERDSFERFCSLALGARAGVLEAIVNRPIYPERIPLSG